MEQQITSFEELYPHIKTNGIYLCEDLHTSYWKEYGGGLHRHGTFIEFSKNLIDQLNAWHIRENEFPVSDFTRTTNSIHFYDSILVVEKKKKERPHYEMRGIPFPFLKNKIQDAHFEKLKLQLLGVSEKNVQTDITDNASALKSFLGDKYEGESWPQTGETMIGYKRLSNIEYCFNQTLKNNIEGDLIETGVWRGGACIFMRAVLKANSIVHKKVWVADSFEGLPKPDPSKFPGDRNDKLYTFSELAISENEVKNNFKKYNLLDD